MSLKQRAYNHLHQRLADGHIHPGGKISLAGVAKEMGVSHIPVREAINQLCSEGYVVHMPSVGFFVRELSRKELADLFKVRESLEVLAAGEAVVRMSDKQLERLEGIFKAMRGCFHKIRDMKIPDWSGKMIDELDMLDMAFHATIVEAADNQALARIVSDQRVLTNIFGNRPIKAQPTSMVQRLAKICRWHYHLLRAFRKRDLTMAKNATAVHIREAGEYVLACIDREEEQKRKDTTLPWSSDPDELMKYVRNKYLNMEDKSLRVPATKGGSNGK
ncbi:MAG: GntR family transcriptional regulator [Pirellulales bacterium]|nr:GntR family transcriptional regulator [Pirellulales bacterium]